MKPKTKKKLFLIVIIIALIVGLIIYLLNSKTRLSSEEKKWLTDNQTTIQNVNVVNNVNIFGNSGEGLFYTFIKDFEAKYNIDINSITNTKNENPNGLSFKASNTLDENSIELYEDHYVLISKNNNIYTSRSAISDIKVGILNTYADYIKSYNKDLYNIDYVQYENEDQLLASIENGEIPYAIIPRMEFIDKILLKRYWINYHFSDMSRYYYITDNTNSMLFKIMQKYYISWSKNQSDLIAKQELSIFKDNLSISNSELDTLRKNGIRYGYVNTVPYETYGGNAFGGIIAEYLKSFSKVTDIEINYKKYSSTDRMLKDIASDNINMYANFYNLNDNKDWKIIDTYEPMIIGVYAHMSNPLVINSNEALKKYKLYMEETILKDKWANNTAETFKTKDLGRITKDKKRIILLDEARGNYFQRNILNDYSKRYEFSLDSTYQLKSGNSEGFNTFLNRYFNYLDPYKMRMEGINDAAKTEQKGSIISNIAFYSLSFILIIALILFLIYRSNKKVKIQKKIKKENKLKYVDQLTSIKNRSYLNENLETWNKNTIYPQTVIMVDLNRVQEINDTEGYEEGDRQIQAAANVLIKTQLDNSDLIRTDGNEFMIYLIGYNQKQITSYLNKLKKELDHLPYEYGVRISYSMIEDDLKSIEDAINECIEHMKKEKEEKKGNEQWQLERKQISF